MPRSNSSSGQTIINWSSPKKGGKARGQHLTSEDYQEAEKVILKRIQEDSFPTELKCFRNGKGLPKSSGILALAPEYIDGLIRVGGRLRRCADLSDGAAHPILLCSKHEYTKLIIQDYDAKLHHRGPERVFAELRRKYWVPRGRESIKKQQ